jgi:hypothetical protein
MPRLSKITLAQYLTKLRHQKQTAIEEHFDTGEMGV